MLDRAYQHAQELIESHQMRWEERQALSIVCKVMLGLEERLSDAAASLTINPAEDHAGPIVKGLYNEQWKPQQI